MKANASSSTLLNLDLLFYDYQGQPHKILKSEDYSTNRLIEKPLLQVIN